MKSDVIELKIDIVIIGIVYEFYFINIICLLLQST